VPKTIEKTIKITPAIESDIDTILRFIRELAVFEKLEDEMVATPDLLKRFLFGEKPAAEVIFLEVDTTKVGFALFFTSFSTFLGKPGIFLEDLFVLPEHRGQGYGKKLLQALASEVVARGYGRLEWSVLNWNQNAIELYLSLGAKPMDEWTVHRLSGPKLLELAAQACDSPVG
jgi:GNAT superfamily N-acetyltransferase